MKKNNGQSQDKLLTAVFILLIIIFSDFSFPQTWREAYSAPVGTVQSIFFVNLSTGFTAGDSCTIRKTYDGGNNWELKYKGATTTTNLRSIFFLNENVGYSVGDYGTFIKTSDGGETWNKISINDVSSTVNSVYFINENEGYIAARVSSGNSILRTTDGGLNWAQVLNSSDDLYEIKFSGGTNGIVVSGSVSELYYTTDGINWTKSAIPSLGGVSYWRTDMYGIHMLDSQNAIAVGNGSVTLGMQPTILLKTSDGGATWNYLEQAEDNKTYQIMKSVIFKDPLNGLAVGGSGYKSALLKTTDGGQNWIPYRLPSGGGLQTIHCIGDNVWAGGNSGVVLYSSDFGSTWELKTKISSCSMYSIQSFGDIVYAGGSDGLFLKSTNRGIDWKAKYAVSNSVSPQIEQIFFLDENTGFLARWYGQVCKTTDGGDSWSTVVKDTFAVAVKNYGVHFVNESLGFVVGVLGSSVDVIYKTTDGGSTWTTITGTVQAPLNSVSFADENNGVIVAGKLRSIYTTNGGATWNPSSFNSVPATHSNSNLLSVTFTDGLNAIAVGDSIILKSSDGGANWNYVTVPGLTQYLTGVSFLNTTGFALGRKEKAPYYVAVYKTEDSGNSWTNIDPDSNIVRPMLTRKLTIDNNNNLWITGAKTYTTASLVGVNEPAFPFPGSFELFQNYPNPFNPSTKIKFNLAEGSLVSIKVYDMLGREIKTLINEYKNSGSYELTFNGDDLSSGIYFYVLRSARNSISKKMTLLK